ncbi:hypothetical protein NDU88_000784 [Pleurodeles waltl]|uniref:Uncharacterized protein n=1 Tax=Pleurodeles waltl TaxID=8319 RepID=A0AAV7MIN4_PLEWA|nr:hypothetical protein NDU88_000784 [Pleurodeles waltl]
MSYAGISKPQCALSAETEIVLAHQARGIDTSSPSARRRRVSKTTESCVGVRLHARVSRTTDGDSSRQPGSVSRHCLKWHAHSLERALCSLYQRVSKALRVRVSKALRVRVSKALRVRV